MKLYIAFWLTATIVSAAVGLFSLGFDVSRERDFGMLTRVCITAGFLLMVGGGLFAIWTR